MDDVMLFPIQKLDPKLYSDRKSWHPELLKTLHDELCSETSKDLISRYGRKGMNRGLIIHSERCGYDRIQLLIGRN